jgi:uncharacterized protein (TIGR04255 family)
MGRKYKAPPIVEAVCEFRLTPDTPWDLTIPGLFYEKVRGTFPNREQRVIQEVELTHEPQGLQQQIRTSERILLFSDNRKMLVQVGPRMLAINALKPYPTWQGLKPHIVKAWESLRDIVEVRGIQRIGLRYINRIELPDSPMKISEYFEFYPLIGSRLPQNAVNFITGADFDYTDGRDRCRLQLTHASNTQENKTFMLDIDYFLAKPRAVDISDALSWVEEAHGRVEEVFEGCITDRLRAMFEEAR